MAIQRYQRTPILGLGFQYGTSELIVGLRNNIKNGNIRYTEIILQEGQRLDTLAGKYYGDGSLFWILAVSSNIGWSLQVPPGTLIKVPNIEDLTNFL